MCGWRGGLDRGGECGEDGDVEAHAWDSYGAGVKV
jgi:hypothetical protein